MEESWVGPLLGALLIAYSVLRLRHAQRSVLVKLCEVTLLETRRKEGLVSDGVCHAMAL